VIIGTTICTIQVTMDVMVAPRINYRLVLLLFCCDVCYWFCLTFSCRTFVRCACSGHVWVWNWKVQVLTWIFCELLMHILAAIIFLTYCFFLLQLFIT